MRYDKQPLNFEQQADQLLSRGLAADRDALINRLGSTSYFRLSGYLYHFRKPDSELFQSGASLDDVWKLCLFDQRLRTLLMDAIEAVEVYIRTQLAHSMACETDNAFSYTEQKSLPNLGPDRYQKWLHKLTQQVKRSKSAKEEFVVHFFNKYGDTENFLPIWSLIELMDFGATFTFYNGISDSVKKQIASQLKIPDVVLTSWLRTLLTLRNRCAHHSRLWNWRTGTPVTLPKARKYPEWNSPKPKQDKIGVILYLLRHLLSQISPESQWNERVEALFEEFPQASLTPLGMNKEWTKHPLWTLKR